MKTLLHSCVLMLMLTMLSASGAQAQADQAAQYAIAPLRGELYLVTAGRQQTVFLATPHGIIVVDPLSRSLAVWLTKELALRFPNTPVKYVLLTHHAADRAAGSGLFVGAERVGHERFNGELNRSIRADPSTYGRVSGVEVRYDERHTIAVGDRIAELIHTEFAHAPEMSLVYFPRERVVFAAGVPAVSAKPFVLGTFRPGEALAWAKTISSLRFDTFVSGHGEVVNRADVMALSDYLQGLVDSVADGYEAGRSLTRVLRDTSLADAGVPSSAATQAQIVEVYHNMRLSRTELFATGVMQLSTPNDAYCRSYTACVAGREVALFSTGITMTRGAFGLTGEITIGQQVLSSRATQFYDEEIARRDSRGAVLVRYAPSPRALSVAVLGGMMIGRVNERGRYRNLLARLPDFGPHPVTRTNFEVGVTGGIEFIARMSSGVSVITPVRVTRTFPWRETSEIAPNPLDIQVGIGLSMRVRRRVH